MLSQPSLASKRGVERLQQGSVAKRLEKTCHDILSVSTSSLIPLTRDEDDRNIVPASSEFPMEIRPGHARHADIDDQTVAVAEIIGSKELFGRGKRKDAIPEFLEQTGQRFPYRLVVIDDRHEWTFNHQDRPAQLQSVGDNLRPNYVRDSFLAVYDALVSIFAADCGKSPGSAVDGGFDNGPLCGMSMLTDVVNGRPVQGQLHRRGTTIPRRRSPAGAGDAMCSRCASVM